MKSEVEALADDNKWDVLNGYGVEKIFPPSYVKFNPAFTLHNHKSISH
jgi:hypothetical protein